MGVAEDWVSQFKLMIPVFHTEFDALQLSFPWFGKIPPCGDFGDFWWLLWLLSPKRLVFYFSDYHGRIPQSLGVILPYSIMARH